MKQILITTLLILMGCVSSVAQSQVQVLSERHAMQRIYGQKNYLMLPVEEAEEEAHVKIIYDNKIARNSMFVLLSTRWTIMCLLTFQ